MRNAQPKIFILTPDAGHFEATWRCEFESLRSSFAEAGLHVQPLGPAEPPPQDSLILPLLAWGYHRDAKAWHDRLDRWETARLKVLNPIDALRWNTSKTYLIELQAAGLPVVPTVALPRVRADDLARARESFRTEMLITKPQIGACAHGLRLLERGATGDIAEPTIIQPFLASVASYGELSLIFFGGRFSHAVRKRPANGDFRVQAEHGGTVTPAVPNFEALSVARAVLAKAPAGLLYARVDLVQDDEGRFRLMEFELIEPQLFLEHAPESTRLFAASLRLECNLTECASVARSRPPANDQHSASLSSPSCRFGSYRRRGGSGSSLERPGAGNDQ